MCTRLCLLGAHDYLALRREGCARAVGGRVPPLPLARGLVELLGVGRRAHAPARGVGGVERGDDRAVVVVELAGTEQRGRQGGARGGAAEAARLGDDALDLGRGDVERRNMFALALASGDCGGNSRQMPRRRKFATGGKPSKRPRHFPCHAAQRLASEAGTVHLTTSDGDGSSGLVGMPAEDDAAGTKLARGPTTSSSSRTWPKRP